MGSRALAQNIKRGFRNVFWGTRAYVEVVIKATHINRVFPDMPVCPDTVWAEEGFLNAGLEGHYDKTNPDGTHESVVISEIFGGEPMNDPTDPWAGVPYFVEKEGHGNKWWTGIKIYYKKDPMKVSNEELDSNIVKFEPIPEMRVGLHKLWKDWVDEHVYGFTTPDDFDYESTAGLILQLSNVGKTGYVRLEKNGDFILTASLKRRNSHINGCAKVCMALRRALPISIRVC